MTTRGGMRVGAPGRSPGGHRGGLGLVRGMRGTGNAALFNPAEEGCDGKPDWNR